jgi:hypothetical protein
MWSFPQLVFTRDRVMGGLRGVMARVVLRLLAVTAASAASVLARGTPIQRIIEGTLVTVMVSGGACATEPHRLTAFVCSLASSLPSNVWWPPGCFFFSLATFQVSAGYFFPVEHLFARAHGHGCWVTHCGLSRLSTLLNSTHFRVC